jgi:periplasmic divalent cation tolerance protein
MRRVPDVDKIALLYTTWPDAETAEAVAAEAVAERLAVCVNILGSGRSIYRWQGAVERAVETVAIFKTTAGSAGRLTAFIVDRHPYDTPAVVALPVAADLSHSPYLDWVCDEASGG